MSVSKAANSIAILASLTQSTKDCPSDCLSVYLCVRVFFYLFFCLLSASQWGLLTIAYAWNWYQALPLSSTQLSAASLCCSMCWLLFTWYQNLNIYSGQVEQTHIQRKFLSSMKTKGLKRIENSEKKDLSRWMDTGDYKPRGMTLEKMWKNEDFWGKNVWKLLKNTLKTCTYNWSEHFRRKFFNITI